ncbi:tetratricopeptide repeat protein [Haliangium sp.]|uniref:tetratricopeptide repeat protein n=1 Tax=Haliangium sp. TaxID=2663208 RepID=UPI003D0AD2BF
MRPTVAELEQLKQQVQYNPGAPAFVQLGEAYLALGRPGEAIEVGVRGLTANPDSTTGRMMLSRAYVMLHQWTEAQTELLKLVKVERNHAAGFALLGEVLLRRNDLERALPVLQHAQNLNPTNPYVEDMIKRARTGVPLDPPPPLPVPQEPTPGYTPSAADPLGFGADEPTRVPVGLSPGAGMASPSAHAPRGADPSAKTIMAQAVPAAHQSPPAPRPVQPAAPAPAPAPAPAKAESKADKGGKKPKPKVENMPPPGPPAGVRPRIVSMDKPTDAARRALREAADVGDFLNTLLTQGLLDASPVRANVDHLGTRKAKRWGRSTLRTFVFLFFLLGASLGGGAYWIYRAEAQRQADVERLLQESRDLARSGTYADLQKAREATANALDRDPTSLRAMAAFARVSALQALIYGTPTSRAEAAAYRAREDISEGNEGWPDVFFAQSVLTVTTLSDETQGSPIERLADTRAAIDAWLEKNPDDTWMRWLQGVAMLAVSDIAGAAGAFEAAEAGGDGPVVATIYRADLATDAGDLEAAMKLYEKALERSPNHPLAVVGKAFVRIARAGEPADILGELNTLLSDEEGPRVDSYKALAFALSYLSLEDFDQFKENLGKAKGVREPRFLARIALAQIANGQLSAATDTRNRIVWYSAEPKGVHPLVAVVDAELQWVSGLPKQALDQVADISNVRARHVRGRALYDLGREDDAVTEFAAILEIASEDWEAQVWHEAARMVTTRGKERREADAALNQLGRQQASKMVRYVHGTAFAKIGQFDDARPRFQQSLDDISEERPNPVAYRAHTDLAGLELARGNVAEAATHLQDAIAINPGYLPAAGMLGRVQVLAGQHVDAVQTLRPVMDEAEAATWQVELAYAEALVSAGRPGKEARDQAAEAVKRAQAKGASAEELARVATLVDESLAAELGAAPPPSERSSRRRRRGR